MHVYNFSSFWLQLMTTWLRVIASVHDAIILAVLVSVCVYIECNGDNLFSGRYCIHAVPLGHKLRLMSRPEPIMPAQY